MQEFIIKYWIEFVFGLIATGGIAWAKWTVNTYKRELDYKHEQELNTISVEIKKAFTEAYAQAKQDDTLLQEQINQVSNDLGILKDGVLAILKKQFISDCHHLLEEEHTVTLEEYEAISHDYAIYKALKGNSQGDLLFSLVTKKYENTLD